MGCHIVRRDVPNEPQPRLEPPPTTKMSALRLNELLHDPSDDLSIEISNDMSTIAMPRLERPAERAGIQRLNTDATTAPTREMQVAMDPDAEDAVVPVAEHAVAPVTEHAVAPVADHAVAPVADHAVAPVAVAPVADHAVAPVAEDAVAPVPEPPAAQAGNFYAIGEDWLPGRAHYPTSQSSRALLIAVGIVTLIALATLASWFFGSVIR